MTAFGTICDKSEIAVDFATWHDVQADCVGWALEISKDYIPDLIVFLAKSGFIFAEVLAECFDCPMVDLKVSRPSNGSKDAIASKIPWIPKPLLAAALKSKTIYGYHDQNSERELICSDAYKQVDFTQHKRILLVDDSVDTGWSMIRALETLREDAPDCEIRTAGYCVIGASALRIKTDYCRHKESIVVTATSRYSKEYCDFLNTFQQWKDGNARYGR